MPRPNACVHCWKPADLRTGRVHLLPSGSRVHDHCVHPLLIELCGTLLAPRPGREVLRRRDARRLSP